MVAPLPSVAVSVKLAFVAVHAATMFAVMFPLPSLALTMPETVTPLTVAEAPPLTVTVTPLGPLSASLTVAISEFETGLPCGRVTPTAATIVGGVLTADGSANVQSENEVTPLMAAVFAVVFTLPPGALNVPLYFSMTKLFSFAVPGTSIASAA